eukprot:snap_masked-scaffold510_size151595-processed-gene-0.5 protein:Tk04752 transcript:snap_masked-scaffold510_size151595-processed-gene-0.5-mRNA-1 annotation:"hypothetical protein DAPPUDRAFT_257105"
MTSSCVKENGSTSLFPALLEQVSLMAATSRVHGSGLGGGGGVSSAGELGNNGSDLSPGGNTSTSGGGRSNASGNGGDGGGDRDPNTNKYACNRCGRSYLHQATLVRHQRYECGISASYPCSLCGRKFKRRDVLKGHMEKCVNKSTAGVVNQSFPTTLSS